jgi:hypothetical protein
MHEAAIIGSGKDRGKELGKEAHRKNEKSKKLLIHSLAPQAQAVGLSVVCGLWEDRVL